MTGKLKLVFGFLAIAFAYFFHYWINGARHLQRKTIKVITEREEVDFPLKFYEKIINHTLGPSDYQAYRGHIYRVLSYTIHFLDGDETHINVIGPALVYHDIGLWTKKTLAYLEPGIELAFEDYGPALDNDDNELMKNIIYYHHKLTPFKGPHADIINAVRKADWIDVTYGLVSQGMPRQAVVTVQGKIENHGFHKMLLLFGPTLYGFKIWKIFELFTILKW